MPNKIYLSGAITGVEDYHEIFAEAESQLVQAGYAVVNPAKVTPPLLCGCEQWKETDHNWLCNMRWDLIAMLQECNKLAFLPGWENSRGAATEIGLAYNLGFQVNALDIWLKEAQ